MSSPALEVQERLAAGGDAFAVLPAEEVLRALRASRQGLRAREGPDASHSRA